MRKYFYQRGRCNDLLLLTGFRMLIDVDDLQGVMLSEVFGTRARPAGAQGGCDSSSKGFCGSSGVVWWHLQGSCAGCPSSTMTLKNGLEKMLRHSVPEVTAVEAV